MRHHCILTLRCLVYSSFSFLTEQIHGAKLSVMNWATMWGMTASNSVWGMVIMAMNSTSDHLFVKRKQHSHPPAKIAPQAGNVLLRSIFLKWIVNAAFLFVDWTSILVVSRGNNDAKFCMAASCASELGWVIFCMLSCDPTVLQKPNVFGMLIICCCNLVFSDSWSCDAGNSFIIFAKSALDLPASVVLDEYIDHPVVRSSLKPTNPAFGSP